MFPNSDKRDPREPPEGVDSMDAWLNAYNSISWELARCDRPFRFGECDSVALLSKQIAFKSS